MQTTIVTRSGRSARQALIAAASAGAIVAAASLGGVAHAADAAAASTASAADAATTDTTAPSAGGEGQHVTELVIKAESTPVTATAPTKASLDEVQPESIITRQFIEQATPETGGWTSVLLIAPSVGGISSNGGGVGDYQTVTLRGFPDGEFNLTFDGIAFGDTNNPTHHSADYFPASTIGAVVVDRGPGAAGDLGQANFGGSIHFFTPDVSDTPGAVQKFTFGSFNTLASVTTLSTGAVPQLGGAKLLLNFDERYSDGELSFTTGHQYNQMAKLVIPIGDHASLTVFVNHEYNYFHFEDSSGPGETWEQTQLLGKNFSMNDNPLSEHYEGYNYELKRTDFEYVDLKDQVTPSFSLEEQPYTYWYSNKTHSTNDLTGVLGPNLNGLNSVPPTANTSPLQAPGANTTDIGGYDKLNEYRVLGDIIRFSQDWSFGTLKWGGLIEGSRTFRHNCFIDDTTGFTPDIKFTLKKFPLLPDAPTNCKLLEESSWLQGQVFADFYWWPTDKLTITPGIKYVDFRRNVNAANENVAGAPTKNQPLVASNTYSSPLYFLTANYKIQPYWSVYGQVATSFLIPELSDLYTTGANLQNLQSEYTTTYQTGTVFTRGSLTADADIYLIEATNLQVSCNVPDPTLPTGEGSGFCNAGKARFDGVEGEFAYALPMGLTIFANASWNEATQLANAANPTAGITANPKQELAGAPEWTDAFGAIYGRGPWRGSLTFKQVGSEVQYNTPTGMAQQVTFHLPSYFTLDGSVGYDFGHFGVKLQGFNLLDQRQINSFTPGANSQRLRETLGSDGGADTGIYTFQAGRMIELTLIGKF
jgi:iron complex outermembrane receptor protein